jgi:hypothetical protein
VCRPAGRGTERPPGTHARTRVPDLSSGSPMVGPSAGVSVPAVEADDRRGPDVLPDRRVHTNLCANLSFLG